MKKYRIRKGSFLWVMKKWSWFFIGAILLVALMFHPAMQAEAKRTEIVEKPIELQQRYDVPLSNDLQDHIKNVCEMYDVDFPLVLAVIGKEANFRCEAVGDNGDSLGLMQVQQKWHQGRMDRLGVTDLLDPYQNVLVGIDILAEKVHKNKGYEWALMAYNSGHQQADFNKNIGVISEYAETVLKIREDIKNG